MEKKTIVDITPDKSLIQKLGLTGYKTEQAISELIDNSIDARISGRTERIDVMLNYGDKIISVSDDGAGMDIHELQNGLTIAKGTKFENTKLGKFGLGMKSSCSTLGKTFTITTTIEGSDVEYFVSYDEDKWLKDKTQTWKNFEIETRMKMRPWHGTTITITNLNVALYPNQTSNFRKNFGIRYGEYLKSKQVELYINTRECKPIEIHIQPGSKKELNIELTKNNYLRGWIGLLEKRSIRDYGIHLYKNNRLIKAFDKFGIRSHPEVAKIIGELHLDHVPVNFHKTGFIEDSLEYKEALDAFRTNPDVIEVLRSSISKAPPDSSIQLVLNYFVNENTKGKIKPRISNASSQTLLSKASSFDFSRDSKNIKFIFEDGNNDELYKIEPNFHGYEIHINRKSPVFEIIGNPLFLIGLIELEVKTILKNPQKYEEFLIERNSAWNKFVREWSEKQEKTSKRKPLRVIPLSSYSLVEELVDLHDFLKDKFEFNFQFTALSTLAPYLQNAYNKMVYNIDTVKNTGQQLYDLIQQYGEKEFTILLNPKAEDLKKALEFSEKRKFIVIREYASISKDTWAPAGEAWVDLFSEMKREGYPIRGDELSNILDHILENNLTSQKRLESIARHKNLLPDLQAYFGNVD